MSLNYWDRNPDNELPWDEDEIPIEEPKETPNDGWHMLQKKTSPKGWNICECGNPAYLRDAKYCLYCKDDESVIKK